MPKIKTNKIAEDESHPQANLQLPWHTLNIEESLTSLKLSNNIIKVGLTTGEAASRLETYGPNTMTEQRKKSIWERIWHQINNVLVYVLLFVAIVSLVQAVSPHFNTRGNTKFTASFQVALIIGVITLNTWIGIYQEGNAEKAAEALKNMLSTDARVLRGGKELMIRAGEIVPGDICLLHVGDKGMISIECNGCF
jgi:magnesium-transporting ATPase (P-type)